MRKIYFLLLTVCVAAIANCQSAVNYTPATNTTASLVLDANGNTVDMSTGTTQLVSSGNDDAASAVSNIGFEFWFMGTRYTQYSVNSNGYLRFGATVISGTQRDFAASNDLVTPFGEDLETSATGKVHIKLVGTGSARCLVVEWLNLGIDFGSSAANGTYQLRLYETTGVIEFVYGTMAVGDVFGTISPVGARIGFAKGTGATNMFTVVSPATYQQPASIAAANLNNYGAGAITDLTSAVDGSRRSYTFTSPVPAAPTGLSFTAIGAGGMTLNWTDVATNEAGYAIYRSTDGVNYTFISQVAAGSTSSVQVGLAGSTLYYWKVYAVTEGALSTSLDGNQTTTGCLLAGTYDVGPGAVSGYFTLKAAADAAVLSGVTGPVIFELNAAYTSATDATFPIVLGIVPCASSTNTITIRPAAGAGAKTITSANTTATIDINGGNYWIIDGQQGGTGGVKDLTIENTSTAGIGVRFINEGSNNVIKYSVLSGVNTSISSGVVVFGNTTGANGNDNNTIDNCNIKDGATTPTNGIYSSGTAAAAQNNSGNTITNNNIFNFFASATDAAGVRLDGGTTDWTVTANNFYQTAARTSTAGSTARGIYINNTSGNNFTVTDNFIGGGAAGAGGTAWTVSGAFANRFEGIRISAGATTASSVQNNTIRNFTWSSTSGATTLPGVWAGIYVSSGIANIGNVAGNTIGASTGTGSIGVTISTTGGVSVGIGSATTSTGNMSISNNTVGSFTVAGNAVGISQSFNGIWVSSSITGTFTINSNTIGSTSTAGSIQYSTAGTGTTAAVLQGILQAATPSAGAVISNNTIANFTNAYVPATANGSSVLKGISATSGSNLITGNTIRNLSTAAATTGSGSTASVIGISMTSTSTTTGVTSMEQNNVFALSNTHATAASAVTGVHIGNATSGRNNVARNLIYDLAASTTSTTADIRGISFTSGLDTVKNNMIRLGTDVTNGIPITGIWETVSSANSAIFFNSIYIGGTGVGTQTGNTYAFRSDQTTNVRTFRNNIFMNARSNATTGGKHYAVRVAGTVANPAGLTLNNNDYFVSGTGGVFGLFNAADVATLAAWQTAVGQDALSLNVDPLYIAPTASTPDLHITSGSTTLESAALAVAGITIDFDNQTRPGAPSGTNTGLAPDIGADEFDGINPNVCSGTPASGGTASASAATVCAGSNITFTLTGATGGPGITYMWQTSPAGAGTWSNTGVTTLVGAFPITGNTDVRNLVTCSVSGLSTPSTIVTVNGINCQFNVTRTTGVTYTSISGTGTSMSGWRNANSTDDNLSTAQPIGFSFVYKGTAYTQFSVSTNGYLTFNVGTSAIGSGTGAYGYENPQFTSTTGTLNALALFYDDLVCQGNPATAAGLAAAMKYQLSGTPGTQVLTVEWIGMETFNNAGPNLNFQVKLYEATGQIEYIYGTMEGFNGTSNYGYSYTLGLNNSTISGAPTVAELQTQQVANVQNFSNTPANTLGRPPLCNSMYTFIPGTYGGAASSPGAPANDEAGTATTVAVNAGACTFLCGTYYTSFNATASAGIPVCSAGTPGTPDDDVWFSFTATTSQQIITVKSGGGYDAVVQLFSDAGITPLNCVNATGAGLTETINATGLTPTSVYYVRVYHAGTGSSSAPTVGTTTAAAGMPDFSICVNEIVPPPSNDDPCGAHLLTVGSTCAPFSDNTLPSKTSFVSATTTTSNGVVTPTCTGAGAVNDVWFSFVAPASGSVNIDVTPVAGVNPAVQVYSGAGTCPTLALTSIGCINSVGTGLTEQTVASTLTPGSTYYIRVYHHPSGIGGTPVSNSQFNICVYAPLPSCPATFTPANAANVCQSGSATTLSWTSGASATGYDVYFDPGAGPATTLVSPNQAGLTYNAGILAPGVYSWRIEPKNGNGTTVCSNLTFTVVAAPSINITPAGPITLCAPGSQLLSLGSTSAASPTYQWRNNGVNISGETGTTYTATISGLFTLAVTDGVTGCTGISNTVAVTVNPQPTVSIAPTAPTICLGNSTALTATATVGFVNIKITEITLFRTGTGQTATYPAYITGADLVEISNVSGSPVDVSGLIFADYSSNSATASHPYTIPAATVIPANGVLVLHLGTGTDDVPNLYFNTGGSNDSWSSGGLVGYVLKSGATIVDAVGLNSGYVFNAGTGVTAGDWSGFAPSAGGFAGTIRTAATDGNTGADWVQSNTPTPLQTIGTYNGGYTPVSATVTYLWTPATGLFTDALLTIPYTTQDIATVYASPATTQVYNVLVTSGAGCPNNANVTVTVLPAGTFLWTGAVNTDWNNAGNWLCGTVPTITSNVIVNSGVPNYPLVNLNVEIKSLTVNPGATVTVATGFELKLNGL